MALFLCNAVSKKKKNAGNQRTNETVPYLTYSDNILPHPIKTLVRQDILIGTPYFKVLNIEKKMGTHRKLVQILTHDCH